MNKKLLFVLALVILVVGLVACENKKEKQDDIFSDKYNPYTYTFSGEIVEAYKAKIEAIEKAHKAEQTELLDNNPDYDITLLTNLKYALAFVNDDDVPELVVSNLGYSVAVYTYANGEVVYTMKDDSVTDEHGLAYGVAGNVGYDYIPRGNIIRNYNNDFAGLIRYVTYRKLDNNQVVYVYDNELKEFHFEDKDGNGTLDENEADDYVDEPTAYFFGENKITKEEYEAKLIDGDYDELAGNLSAAELTQKLNTLTK